MQLVCGSDGQTYSSECQLKLYACRYQKDIVVKSHTSCKGNVTEHKFSHQQLSLHVKRKTCIFATFISWYPVWFCPVFKKYQNFFSF